MGSLYIRPCFLVGWNDFSLSVTSTTQWSFYSKDHLGSTRVVFNESNQFESAMDYMPFGEIMREHNVGGTSYQYTGQEYDKESGIHNYRARLYDSDLGRFYGMDPQEQFASPFSYAANNPIMNTDPDGEFVFSAILPGVGTIIDAALWGAVIGTASNGINNVMHQQSFFDGAGRAAWQGALGGAISGGIGLAAGHLGTSVAAGGAGWSKAGVGAFQAGAHALSGGLQSTLAGGNFKSGFLSGGISSSLGSLTAGWGDAGQLFTGIVGGGIGSELGGGNFIDGAQMGAITVGLNHLAHGVARRIEIGLIAKRNRQNFYKVNLNSDDQDYILRGLLRLMYEVRNGETTLRANDAIFTKNGGNNWNLGKGQLYQGWDSGSWSGKGILFGKSVRWSARRSLLKHGNEYYDDVEYRAESFRGRKTWSLNVVTGSARTSRITLRFYDNETLLKASKIIFKQ